jgi:hypothetical protein
MQIMLNFTHLFGLALCFATQTIEVTSVLDTQLFMTILGRFLSKQGFEPVSTTWLFLRNQGVLDSFE